MKPGSRHIVLGVTGSIAACKAVDLLRLLVHAGHDVRVVQTPASRHFVGEMLFQAVSGRPVAWDQFDPGRQSTFGHIEMGKSDLMVIAPATANTIGKMAAGIADNLLLTTYLAAQCPIIVCPAMNHHMWNHVAVQDNVNRLVERGVKVVPPGTGKLACGEEGTGRLAEPEEIFAAVQELLEGKDSGDLKGARVLITAGGTREPIDAVRFITNRSSGKMGFAIAAAAKSRGADVTVVAANCGLPRIPGVRHIDVTTASEMKDIVVKEAEDCDVMFMAAAVSDYKVSGTQTTGKIARGGNMVLQLEPTGDIVSDLGNNSNGRIIVGFAAEYGKGNLERARRKLDDKNLDMVVFNDISRPDVGFESDHNEIIILAPGSEDMFVGKTTKTECAHRILDEVKKELH